jgi:Hemerythrin HHE cation binding domain
MPTRDQLVAALRSGDSYEQAAEHFGIPAGQAYMIATGLAADGSDALGPEFLARREEFLIEGGSQHLANPPTDVPTEDEGVLAWIKQRAHADTAMQQSAAARTAEPPEIQDPSGSDDVVDLLGRDHNQVKFLQEQLEAIPGVKSGGSEKHQQQRVSILDMMRVRLSQHETVEEEYFWPAVRDTLPDGADLADKAQEQEQEGKDLLQALMGKDGGDEEFDELVEKLSAALRKHVAFEDLVFLKVRDGMSGEQRIELRKRMEKAKKAAPTRPHPHAPAGSKLAAASAAPLDKVRDELGSRPAERKGKAEDEPEPQPDDES